MGTLSDANIQGKAREVSLTLVLAAARVRDTRSCRAVCGDQHLLRPTDNDRHQQRPQRQRQSGVGRRGRTRSDVVHFDRLGLGSSLAVELSFEIKNTDLLSVSVNNTDWPINTPGNDPFAKGVTTGVDADLAGDTVFASLLSNFFTSGNPVEVLTIETDGTDCTSLSWGGHTVLGGTANEYETSLIAQAGQNFTGYEGTASVPVGDFDADCDVDGADLIEWQQEYGDRYDSADLTDWEGNYGTVAPVLAATYAVPEPASWLLLLGSLTVGVSLVNPRPRQR